MSATAISASLLIGAGFFALGYLLARHKFSSSPSPSLWSRLLFWSHKSATPDKKVGRERDSTAIAGRNRKEKKPLLEIENLAEIIEDFKMVSILTIKSTPFSFSALLLFSQINSHPILSSPLLSFCLLYAIQVLVVRNDLKMGKGKIAAQCRYIPSPFYARSFYSFSCKNMHN
jgi:Peptidyl-tRNA hydrolase PTH2